MKRIIVFAGTVVLLAVVWGHYCTRPEALGKLKQRLLHLSHWQQTPVASVPRSPQPASFSLASTGQPNPTPESPKTDETISNADFASKLDALILNPDPNAAETMRSLIRRWTELNPSAAAAWTARLSPGPVYQDALQQVVVAWAEVDLLAARQWLATLPDEQARRAALISLGYEAARVDPIMSLELARRLSASPERDDLLVHATGQWANADLEAALAWAREVADPALRQRLISSIASASAKLDGAAAAGIVATLMAPGDEQNRAAVAVVQRWAQAAPQAAADWVALYPEGPVRAAAARSLLDIQTAQKGNPDGTRLQEDADQTGQPARN